MKNTRLKIGMLVSGISDFFTIQLCRGIIRHAAELGVNIFILPGKYINRDVSGQPELIYEYQYATVFSFAKKENLDGLIIAAGCIGCLTNRENLMKLLKTFDDIPSVLVASNYEGYTCVCYDNKNAVVEGIEYLIKKAGRKHICLLDGKPGNSDAIERRQAYLDTLEKHGVVFEERMAGRGDLSYDEDTRNGMRALLRDNPDMDAVFCANDETAMAAYDVLKEQGLVVGKDVLVMGYDNIHASTTMEPPLSTVSAEPVKLGMESLDAVLRKIRGEEISNITMPSRFILRESFGRILDISEVTEDTEKDFYETSFETVFFHYINSFGRDKAA
ncbi:MAG: substrate-binding domain-containing protein, partial [Lachnospiraceae bacterium]|nr:substrate-binding domain-containing protein [Lachnospiraceae bacterium]